MGAMNTWWRNVDRSCSLHALMFLLCSCMSRSDEQQVTMEIDEEWKRIQEKTFTRWCNEQLKVQSIPITNLSQDFSDGVKLIALLEVLSQKRIGRFNKKPRVHAQKMENVQMALDFITKKEGIRLVNIGMSCLALHLLCNWKGKLSDYSFNFFSCLAYYEAGMAWVWTYMARG